MSIFQVREWWSTDGDQDEDDVSNASSVSLGVFPQAGDSEHADLVVSGSLGGVIRVYSPFKETPDEDKSNAANLLLEKQLDDPILQTAIGKLGSS